MTIIYNKHVTNYLNNLVDLLYKQDYFGMKDSAYNYVDWLFERIEKDIHTRPAKKAPEYFSKYGKNLSYLSIKKNMQTTWYVFFNHEDDLFYIRYISNNHMIGQYL